MAKGPQLQPHHIPKAEQRQSQPPPRTRTMEEAGEVGENGEEEVNPNDVATPSISPPAVALPHLPAPSYSPLPKKGTGRRKKNPLSTKQRAVAEQRLVLLNENFCPVPFSPGKALDFSAHEQLFHALGLWDFAHLELDRDVRPDLLAHLIAYYDSSNRRSYVHTTRISVSRVDLARAIRLPAKKEKANSFQGKDWSQELISVDGATEVLLDFMSNYMLFEDDMCILPSEIIQAIQFVKDGVPYMVDWAAIMWILVEKELMEAPKSGTCCYASHLQRLIKHQHPSLFSKEPEPVLPELDPEEEEVSVADEAVNLAEDEVNAAEEVPLAEEEGDADIRKVRSLEDLLNVASERHNSEFGFMLGDHVMDDFDDCKVSKESKWLEEGKDEGFDQCLRRCNSKASDSMHFEILTKVDEEKQEMRFADDFPVKFSNLQRPLLQEMNNVNIPYAQQVNSLNPSSGVLLTMGADSHKNIILNSCSSGSTYFGNIGKRQVDEIGDEEEDLFYHKSQQKRMSTCQDRRNLPFSSECIDQIQGSAKTAKALLAQKSQEVVNMEMEVQYLTHLDQDKEQEIQSLKMMLEVQQNCHMAVRHYERELCLATQMMLGYKAALKEARCRFSVYRKKHPHDDESLYRDVPGTGGLVLSAREFEKNRLVKEEENRQELLGTFSKLEKILNKFQDCKESILMHDRKLGKFVGEMEQLKEGFVKSSCSGT